MRLRLGPRAWTTPIGPQFRAIENRFRVGDIGGVEQTLEQMARLLAESGHYRVTSRLKSLAEYHPPDDTPKLVAATVDVETTGTNPDNDKIIELGICLFEYELHSYNDHVSILKFIERNWGLKPLTTRSRDNLPNPQPSASNPYVPANSPAIGDLFDMFRFPMSSEKPPLP
jgi:hypothetical protein